MPDDEIHSITTARTAKRDDVLSREVRYGIAMGIRTLCFVGAVVTWNLNIWVGGVCLAGALVLPYTSVVLANAGMLRRGSGRNLINESGTGPSADRPAIGD